MSRAAHAPDVRNPLVDAEPTVSELSLAQEAMGIITWLWDLTAGRVHWTGDLSPLLGQPRGSFGGNFAEFLRVMHPDDMASSRLRMRACLRGDEPTYRVEERVVWPDGSVHWLETYGRAAYGADGRALRLAGVIRDTSERRRAQDDLQANEARLRRLIEDAPVAIGMSRGDQILSGNSAFLRLFGYPDQVSLCSRRVPDLVAPSEVEHFVARGQRRDAGEAVETDYEMALRRADGSEFNGLVSVSEAVLADGPAAAVFIQDLSEAVRQRKALQRERDRANQYLQIAQAVLVELDERGHITVLNQRGLDLMGHRAEDLRGRNWFETFRAPDEAAQALARYRDAMVGRTALPPCNESVLLTRSGERRRFAWRNGLLLDEQGRPRGMLSSGEDITERRRAEDEIHALAAQLEQRVRERTAALEASNLALIAARDAAEAGTRAKGEFLAHMSHEIRTPMNAIIGMTHLALQAGELPARPRGYLKNIQRAADSLLAIINDVLDYSKLESGHVEIDAGEFSLAEVLDRVRSMVALVAAEKGLALLMQVAPGVPATLVGDPQRLGQVLLNLCGNAVKFTERGEIRVTVGTESEAGDRVRLRFAVRDTGIGIPPEQIGRLFSPFDQLDASITRRFGGTGLGLAISHQLVLRMGGVIGVHSEHGRGSEFHFTLDFQRPTAAAAPVVAPRQAGNQAPAASAAPAAPADRPLARLQGRRLLLVEDNELNQIVAGDLLREVAGATVCIARNGLEALQLLREQRFDAVLMDLQMPQMDGFEATRALRADPALAGLPVIAITAHALARDRERCLAAGMNDFVTKPFEPRELFAVLASWLPEAAASPEREPAVDFALGLDRCLGREDLYTRILGRFVASRADDGARLRRQIADGDPAGARELVHTLISTAGTIGAEALSATARALHIAIDEDDRQAWPALAERLERQHGAVLAAVHGRLLGLPPTLAA